MKHFCDSERIFFICMTFLYALIHETVSFISPPSFPPSSRRCIQFQDGHFLRVICREGAILNFGLEERGCLESGARLRRGQNRTVIV